MTHAILDALGGLGLFLLGMVVMTGGLRELAGGSLRRWLRRFTRSSLGGAASGAVVTAVLQSSSATTVMAVGFVGAGLITFPQALGVVLGANLGTTVTGWLVALFGFQVPLATLAYPIVLVGALLRLLGRGSLAAAGEALAGFGLVFVGIEQMQAGLAGLEGVVTPASFPDDSWLGRLQLVGIGAALTLVTQSSSAGVALALTALVSGAISFPQAAAMVIGMDVGTTSTALLASFGGATGVRRTAASHVVFNVLTGALAFFLLDPYGAAVDGALGAGTVARHPELALVGFHSSFNLVGLAVGLPLAGVLATVVAWLVPIPGDDPTHRLALPLLGEPDAALDAVERTLWELAARVAAQVHSAMARPADERDHETSARLHDALTKSWDYTLRIRRSERGETRARYRAAIHVADHLDRLLSRLRWEARLRTIRSQPELAEAAERLRGALLVVHQAPERDGPSLVPTLGPAADALAEARRAHRKEVIAETVGGGADAGDVEARLDAMRWLARVAHHLWRIAVHLERLREDGRPREPGSGRDVDFD